MAEYDSQKEALKEELKASDRVEGIVSHDHRRVAHYQRCVSQPGAAWCCLVLTALDKAVEHLYRQHTRLLGKETWTIQYSALDFKWL